MAETYLSTRQASALIGCGRSTIWHWAANGVVPKPIKIGGMTRWKLSDLEAVLAEAEAKRDAK